MLNDPSKKVGESNNILARLFRTVIFDLNISHEQLSRNIGNYLNRQQSSVARSVKEQTRERGNLVKELAQDALTWKNFIKGLQVLNPVSAEIKLTLKWGRGHETEHKVHIAVRPSDDDFNRTYNLNEVKDD